MSSALKRRFNFETVHPIADPEFERELVLRQLAERLGPAGVAVTGRARRGRSAGARLPGPAHRPHRRGRQPQPARRGDVHRRGGQRAPRRRARGGLSRRRPAFGRGMSRASSRESCSRTRPRTASGCAPMSTISSRMRAGRSGAWKEFYQAARSLKLG
ncbi:MAG: hypothetical protein WDN24_11900 [Sphingomonas sp.]